MNMKLIRENFENKPFKCKKIKDNQDYKTAINDWKELWRILYKKGIIKPHTLNQDSEFIDKVIQKKHNLLQKITKTICCSKQIEKEIQVYCLLNIYRTQFELILKHLKPVYLELKKSKKLNFIKKVCVSITNLFRLKSFSNFFYFGEFEKLIKIHTGKKFDKLFKLINALLRDDIAHESYYIEENKAVFCGNLKGKEFSDSELVSRNFKLILFHYGLIFSYSDYFDEIIKA